MSKYLYTLLMCNHAAFPVTKLIALMPWLSTPRHVVLLLCCCCAANDSVRKNVSNSWWSIFIVCSDSWGIRNKEHVDNRCLDKSSSIFDRNLLKEISWIQLMFCNLSHSNNSHYHCIFHTKFDIVYMISTRDI